MSTNVPAPAFTRTGLVLPTEAAVLAGVQADLNSAFGGNLNPALNTPQGQMASSMAAAISNIYAAFAFFVNNVNPNAAAGFMQDAIGFIYFLLRIAGTPTAVQCTCVGLSGTVIPAGSQAQDTSGNLYESNASAVIGSGGSVTITFLNVVNGPVACPSGTLSQIYQAVTGWDAITNPANGVEGTYVESENAFAYRMKSSVAANSQGFLASIFSALAAQVGAQNVYCTENDTGGIVDTGTTQYPLAANSIYIAVVGGVPSQIAQTIFSKKSPGCNYNGNTSVVVYDTSYPPGAQPSYTIEYEVPTVIDITFVVSIKNSTTLPSNIANLVQAAIIAQLESGSASVPGAGIAANIIAANYFSSVIAAFPSMALLGITLGTGFSGVATLNNTSATMVVTGTPTGYLAIGDVVTGTGIPANTTILAGPAGGRTGSYTLSAAATASGTGVAVASNTGVLTEFQCGIDQAPTTAAPNITVNLI
jgi:uncharacterized phage protein gp47/JayE